MKYKFTAGLILLTSSLCIAQRAYVEKVVRNDSAKTASPGARNYYLGVQANQLIGQVGEKWRNAMRLALIDFRLERTSEPVFVWGDVDNLHRLFTILLDNAIRYTPPGGTVRLKAAEKDGHVVFTVRDTGIGIPHEYQDRVFDRFYRVDRRRGGGAGLGLALAKVIAEKHGTTLLLDSETGKGTSFEFAIATATVASQANCNQVSASD